MPQVLAAAAHHVTGNDYSLLPLEIILVLVGVVIGRIWGRRSALKHLGESEFRGRWTAVRRISKW